MMHEKVEEYKKLRNGVEKAKNERDKLHQDKELWFKKKEELKNVMNEKITKLKSFKKENDKTNISIQELKQARDEQNKLVKGLIRDIKKFNKDKKKTLEKYNSRTDPTKILHKINELEQKVEIETSFKREEKLMEQIKKFRKEYEDSSEIRTVIEQKNNIESEIKEAKKKADKLHSQMMELAKDTDYAEFITLSQEIAKIKKEQENSFQKFIEAKNNYFEANKKVQDHIKASRDTRKELENKKIAVKEIIEEQTKEKLRQKSQEVEEKIKKGKKLTTEDIIAFQGG